MSTSGPWFVYVIRASDESLYTGITTDVQRRFEEHCSPEKGARYFRGRQPVEVVYRESHPDRSSASRREASIKNLSRSEKLKLVGGKQMLVVHKSGLGAPVDNRHSVSRSKDR